MSAYEPALGPSPTERPPSSGWRIASPVLSTLAALALGIVIAGLFSASGVIGDDALNAVVSFGISLLILAGGVLVWSRLAGHERRAALALKHTRGGAIGLGVTVGIGAMILSGSIIFGATLIDGSIEDKLEEREDVISGAAWQIALLVVAIVVLAPIGEELVFRGLLLRALCRRLGFLPAAIVSSLVFAAFHLDQYVPYLWPRTVALVATGVVLALLYHWRGYWAAVAAHATVNLVAAIALLAAA